VQDLPVPIILLLGDRIAPQSIQRGPPGSVMVNFAERSSGESFAVQPSIGKTLWLHIDPATLQFREWVRDF